MRIIAKSTLKAFWEQPGNRDAEQPLKAWYEAITDRNPANPHDLISYFPDADNVGNGRMVFNICRNKYRLIVAFRYDIQVGFVKFVGSHKEYDKIQDIKNI